MSKIEVNKIGPQCGTTLTVGCGSGQTVTVDANTVTLGRSGGTVSLASGATQSGFGRTGTVDWCTTAKTSPFTAVSGDGYFVNTTSGAVTVTLPASPSAGDIVAVADYNCNAATNNITLGRNSSNINGDASDFTIAKDSGNVALVYVDGTEGWRTIQAAVTSTITETFMCASGGTITTCGNFKVHTFTSDGTFTVNSLAESSPNNVVDYVVVAGGGSGGAGRGGGGGAGGMRLSDSGYACGSPIATGTGITVTATSFPITIGGGGAAKSYPSSPMRGDNGNNSVFSTITSAGGGAGGGENSGGASAGASGGSGGGGATDSSTAKSGGSGNSPPVSPPQGNAGGNNTGGGSNAKAGGGGGGAAAAGAASTTSPAVGGAGGIGSFVPSDFGSPGGTPGPVSGAKYFSGGGGGSPSCSSPSPVIAGGAGGGGTSGASPTSPAPVNTAATAGTANTGGGGGGGGHNCARSGGNGGSGIVVIRYRYQ